MKIMLKAFAVFLIMLMMSPAAWATNGDNLIGIGFVSFPDSTMTASSSRLDSKDTHKVF